MNKEERMSLIIKIIHIMQSAVSDDYAGRILKHKSESGTTLLEDIVQNVLETSAYEDEGYYNYDDIKLAIERELSARLGIEEQKEG